MNRRKDTVIIGGGQAGLSASYFLTRAGRDHTILETAPHLAHAWRDERWDSFTMATPNWTLNLPEHPYRGDRPDGFVGRDEIVRYLEDFASGFDAPVELGVTATKVGAESGGLVVEAGEDRIAARNVIVATGSFQRPRVPASAGSLPGNVLQLVPATYKNPAQLPPGAVLVVGSAQSGCQIADELLENGRQVYLAAGSAPRVPRRYRGRDIFYWLGEIGFFDRKAADLPNPRAKFGGNPHVTGNRGGRTLNLHAFARDGIELLGSFAGADGPRLRFRPNLHENLAKADAFSMNLEKTIDTHVERKLLYAPLRPQDVEPEPLNGFSIEQRDSLDLEAAGIRTVVWATGFAFDYSLVDFPVLDADGFPIQQRGVTAVPGLYFLGMHFLDTAKSTLMYGVGADAEHVVSHLLGRD
jgi:putative flavoprotein involved in K+ transport